jgi:hypothetical protein
MTDHIQNVCKIGQGDSCCRYLVVGSKGFECMKTSPDNKAVIDRAWASTPHVAQGDNCEGVTDLAKFNVLTPKTKEA